MVDPLCDDLCGIIYQVDSRQGVVLQLVGLARGYHLLTVKKQLVTKCYIGPRNWRAFVNTVMNLRVP